MSGPGYCGCCGGFTRYVCMECARSCATLRCACGCGDAGAGDAVPARQPLSEQEVAWRVEAAARALPLGSVAMGADEWKRSHGR